MHCPPRSKLLYELHTSLKETAAERLHGLMAMERAHVWTNNNHYMAEAKALFQAMLMNQLSKVAVQKLESQLGGGRGLPNDTNMKAALNMLKSTFGCEFTVEDLGMMAAQKRQLCEHPDDESLLDLIAGALAYLKVGADCLESRCLPGLVRLVCWQLRSQQPCFFIRDAGATRVTHSLSLLFTPSDIMLTVATAKLVCQTLGTPRAPQSQALLLRVLLSSWTHFS